MRITRQSLIDFSGHVVGIVLAIVLGLLMALPN
jgi:hypothetical protein